VIRKMSYRWHLRQLMADQELFQTSQLAPLLAERGIQLSREQVYRLVTGTPQRLSLEILAALCDILACSPNELIEIVAAPAEHAKPKAARGAGKSSATAPKRTAVRRPKGL
jgi:DNA-binding Xre family transcriptional regulator